MQPNCDMRAASSVKLEMQMMGNMLMTMLIRVGSFVKIPATFSRNNQRVREMKKPIVMPRQVIILAYLLASYTLSAPI